jgi:penicillin-binding protein 2
MTMHAPARQQESDAATTMGGSLRVLFVALVMFAALAALVAKLWYEQLTPGQKKKWSDKVMKTSFVTVRVPSVRGEIKDRRGVTLAENRTSYCVDFYLPQIVKAYREHIETAYQEAAEKAVHEKRPMPPKPKFPMLPRRKIVDGMPKEVLVADIVRILDESVIPKFEALGIDRDDPLARLYFEPKDFERHYETNEQVPFHYLSGVKFDTMARIAEANLGTGGIELAVRPVRHYKFGALAAHILGHVGKVEQIDAEPDFFRDKAREIKEFTYYEPDIVGKASVELAMDKYLRGTPGRRILERTVKGKIGAEKEFHPPVPGYNVLLTLDVRIQAIVEGALREAGVTRASAVVVDPNNGDVLAMVSIPSYDSNIVYGIGMTEDEAKEFKADETIPLLNRSVQGYVPGSTYKLVTALAALAAGLPPTKTYVCTGEMRYPAMRKPMRCHKIGGHGALSMSDAIKKSCNCYFYQLANGIEERGTNVGLEYIERVGTALGLGMKSGLPVSGERPGTLPGPAYLTSKGLATEIKFQGSIANTSIGQGRVEVSPLQIAMVAATLANGGTSYFPRLISRVVDVNNNDVKDAEGKLVVPAEPRIRARLSDLGIEPWEVEVVRKGMWRVVNESGGTGSRGKVLGVEVAAKTGTAQFSREDENGKPVKDNRVWFMCFAPYQQPKYAVSVMVEAGWDEELGGGNASGGKVSAPIAQKILRECFALELRDAAPPAPFAPAKGSFETITEVKLKDDGSLVKLVAGAFGGTDHKPSANDDDERPMENEDAPVERRSQRPTDEDVRRVPKSRRTAPAAPRQPTFLEKIFSPRQPANNQPGGLRR